MADLLGKEAPWAIVSGARVSSSAALENWPAAVGKTSLLYWGPFPSCEAIEEQGRLIGLALKVAALGGFATVLQFLQFVS